MRFILWFLLGIRLCLGDKLDRTYLPPSGSKFSGGSDRDLIAPLDYSPPSSVTQDRPNRPEFGQESKPTNTIQEPTDGSQSYSDKDSRAESPYSAYGNEKSSEKPNYPFNRKSFGQGQQSSGNQKPDSEQPVEYGSTDISSGMATQIPQGFLNTPRDPLSRLPDVDTRSRSNFTERPSAFSFNNLRQQTSAYRKYVPITNSEVEKTTDEYESGSADQIRSNKNLSEKPIYSEKFPQITVSKGSNSRLGTTIQPKKFTKDQTYNSDLREDETELPDVSRSKVGRPTFGQLYSTTSKSITNEQKYGTNFDNQSVVAAQNVAQDQEFLENRSTSKPFTGSTTASLKESVFNENQDYNEDINVYQPESRVIDESGNLNDKNSASDSQAFVTKKTTSAYKQKPERKQADNDRSAVVIDYKNFITPEGEFSYSYDTSNGIHADENGTSAEGVKAQGTFSYTGDDGKFYSIIYSADENGFQPQGDHLPTPPPIPKEILRVIEQAQRDKEAGIFNDGKYDEAKYGYKKYTSAISRKPQDVYMKTSSSYPQQAQGRSDDENNRYDTDDNKDYLDIETVEQKDETSKSQQQTPYEPSIDQAYYDEENYNPAQGQNEGVQEAEEVISSASKGAKVKPVKIQNKYESSHRGTQNNVLSSSRDATNAADYEPNQSISRTNQKKNRRPYFDTSAHGSAEQDAAFEDKTVKQATNSPLDTFYGYKESLEIKSPKTQNRMQTSQTKIYANGFGGANPPVENTSEVQRQEVNDNDLRRQEEYFSTKPITKQEQVNVQVDTYGRLLPNMESDITNVGFDSNIFREQHTNNSPTTYDASKRNEESNRYQEPIKTNDYPVLGYDYIPPQIQFSQEEGTVSNSKKISTIDDIPSVQDFKTRYEESRITTVRPFQGRVPGKAYYTLSPKTYSKIESNQSENDEFDFEMQYPKVVQEPKRNPVETTSSMPFISGSRGTVKQKIFDEESNTKDVALSVGEKYNTETNDGAVVLENNAQNNRRPTQFNPTLRTNQPSKTNNVLRRPIYNRDRLPSTTYKPIIAETTLTNQPVRISDDDGNTPQTAINTKPIDQLATRLKNKDNETRILGEDFRGPQQPQYYNPETGYHY